MAQSVLAVNGLWVIAAFTMQCLQTFKDAQIVTRSPFLLLFAALRVTQKRLWVF
ncbi:MAG: hypothetical protein H7Z11_04240 [Verrucomicrobia bacterium]|nr:hypothetical protein [Leptolyngbya sp. ES-bin-22]